MAQWVAKTGGGDVTVKLWLEDGGVLVLSRAPGAGADYKPVAKNKPGELDLKHLEEDPQADAIIAYEVDAVAASVGGAAQTLWHCAEQAGQPVPAYDDQLNPLPLGANGGLALAPDCANNQREQRWFPVIFQ